MTDMDHVLRFSRGGMLLGHWVNPQLIQAGYLLMIPPMHSIRSLCNSSHVDAALAAPSGTQEDKGGQSAWP